MSQAEIIKGLKVKTSALKRVHKESSMYERERDKEQGRVDKLRAENADSHDIKQAVRAALLHADLDFPFLRKPSQDCGVCIIRKMCSTSQP